MALDLSPQTGDRLASTVRIIQSPGLRGMPHKRITDNSDHLLELSRDQNNENPKLKRLEEILKEHFQSSLCSRGIIFTRTRQSTHSLHNWITSNSTLKERNIKSAPLTGAGFSNQTKHMTQNEQQEVIENFRKGSLNLLISTSVAEEGLNIPECNIVVRYGLMTNEIAMVQARGRARAEDSCYSFLAKSGGKESRRERTNESLEDLMKRAIEHVQKIPEKEYNAKILDLQLSSVIERQMKQAKVEQKKKFNPQDVQFYCRNCATAVGHGSDFRVVEGVHHVNINPTFNRSNEQTACKQNRLPVSAASRSDVTMAHFPDVLRHCLRDFFKGFRAVSAEVTYKVNRCHGNQRYNNYLLE
ncbi:hypothetical protein AB205_0166730 [Aquarana catesbeiana]|uniref:RNA helicase n=1 Tax=Aquarana catesbeiana TaxID=8400 RepID=A0A2G9S782_AQUCT|nr:hypothetical protein AB205_0166730 [Aquarana catesbeiana]